MACTVSQGLGSGLSGAVLEFPVRPAPPVRGPPSGFLLQSTPYV